MAARGAKLDLNAIARHCGVSRSTVSKALNPDRTRCDLSDALRTRIRDAAQQLGYRAENSRRWVGHRLPRTVGLVYGRTSPYLSGPYARLPDLLARSLATRGWFLQFSPLPDGVDAQALLRRHGIEAALVVQPDTDAVDTALLNAGIPAVAVNLRPRVERDAVLADDRAAMTAVGRHLTGLGHRRIAYLLPASFEPHLPSHYSEAARRAGLREALAEVGGSLHEASFASLREAVPALAEWLRREAPTAVAAYDAGMAARAYQAARLLGWRIPDDLSVASPDVQQLGELLAPELTGVTLDLDHLTEAAVERLLQRIDRCDEPCRELLVPGRWWVGASTAKPANGARAPA